MPPNFENRGFDRDYWNRRQHRHRHAGLVPAVVLISVGAIFLLNNLHIFYFRDVWRFWPAILIALGLVKVVDATDHSGRTGGAILLVLGAIFLAPNLGLWDISIGELWPLFLIGLGVILLSQRVIHFQGNFGSAVSGGVAQGTLSESALFSGGKRRVVTPDFRGGQMSAIFGGFEIDLRKAGMEGDSAILALDAIFGGMDIRVPENWDVILEITAVFGGCDDKTMHPDPSLPGVKRLILRGAVIFGGIDVKN
jgi:Domain of unknown function (DUF5668)/Cell wall-active antibiotics response 4TMS YvqF